MRYIIAIGTYSVVLYYGFATTEDLFFDRHAENALSRLIFDAYLYSPTLAALIAIMIILISFLFLVSITFFLFDDNENYTEKWNN